ncbi:MAG: type II toxin-antitoxin system HicB family antitoxin [Proteobacteria bacterium]|nr:type II toxin-antitoxin system HicB family antitoxin [Pseudomonadota bacterium]
MKSIYTAIIEKEGDTYGVYFPDFDGCVSVGNTVPEVMRNAEEVLVFHIQGMQEDGEDIPLPSEPPQPEDIRANEFLALISVDVGARSRRVNVMLNEFLLSQIDEVASNRSGFLAEAAREKLTRLRDGTD